MKTKKDKAIDILNRLISEHQINNDEYTLLFNLINTTHSNEGGDLDDWYKTK